MRTLALVLLAACAHREITVAPEELAALHNDLPQGRSYQVADTADVQRWVHPRQQVEIVDMLGARHTLTASDASQACADGGSGCPHGATIILDHELVMTSAGKTALTASIAVVTLGSIGVCAAECGLPTIDLVLASVVSLGVIGLGYLYAYGQSGDLSRKLK